MELHQRQGHGWLLGRLYRAKWERYSSQHELAPWVVKVSNTAGTGAKFHGYLNPQRPPGSSPRYSGYCAIRSKPRKVRRIAGPYSVCMVFHGYTGWMDGEWSV